MNIEGAKTRHVPHYLGQHAEGHHYLQVSTVTAQLLHKYRVFHLLRLQDGQPVLQRIALHLRRLQGILMPSHGFVGLSNNSHHVISSFHESL